MKHDDERRHDEANADDALAPESLAPEARLAAHLFGELEADEARAFEAELERSPELSAERDVLARTAALVKDALPPEALSAELRATLLATAEDQRAAARRSGFRLVPAPVRRAAVGLAAAVLVLVGLRPWMVEEVSVETLGDTSRVEFGSAPASGAEDAFGDESRRSLGFVEAAGRLVDRSLGQPPGDELERLARLRSGEKLAEDREGWSRGLDEEFLGGITVDTRSSNSGGDPLTLEPNSGTLRGGLGGAGGGQLQEPQITGRILSKPELGVPLQSLEGEVLAFDPNARAGWDEGELRASFSFSGAGPVTGGGGASGTSAQVSAGPAPAGGGGGGGPAQPSVTTYYGLPLAGAEVAVVKPQTGTAVRLDLYEGLLMDFPVEIANGATIAPPLVKGFGEDLQQQLGRQALQELQRGYFRASTKAGYGPEVERSQSDRANSVDGLERNRGEVVGESLADPDAAKFDALGLDKLGGSPSPSAGFSYTDADFDVEIDDLLPGDTGVQGGLTLDEATQRQQALMLRYKLAQAEAQRAHMLGTALRRVSPEDLDATIQELRQVLTTTTAQVDGKRAALTERLAAIGYAGQTAGAARAGTTATDQAGLPPLAQEDARTRVPVEPVAEPSPDSSPSSPDPTQTAQEADRRPLPAEEAADAAAQQEAVVELLHGRILSGLEPEEGESADQLFFRYWGDNPWTRTAEQALSTFAADVDTGSFGVVRRLLRAERLPRPEQVRTEELLNWWRADVPAPAGGEDFRVALEAAPSRFGPRADAEGDVVLLRVALRGRDVDRRARKPLALTLVVDVSGSMDDHGRIQLVRDAAKLLLSELSTTDSIALVTFGTEAETIVPMTSASNRGPFEDALDTLDPDGGTNVEAGLVAGYELAAAELTPGAVNRVVFLSDGVGNIGETDQERILGRVADERAQGVYLSTLGIGYGVDSDEEYADDFLEQLADGGDGLYHNINDAADAERYLVDQFTASLQPIARDVKIQVEFDDDQVAAWRQLGYENRSLTAQQFRDDTVDAGEVHAGHQVNALYELRVRPGVAAEAALATARVRWKQPFAVDSGALDADSREAAEVAQELEASIAPGSIANAFGDTSAGYRRAALVAQLAELLRRSVHAQGDAPSELLAEMEALAPVLGDPDFDELLGLLRGVRTQLEALADELGPLDHKVDEIRRRQVDLLAERERLRAEAEADAKARRQAEVDRLRGEIDRLEQELRDALEDQVGPQGAANR